MTITTIVFDSSLHLSQELTSKQLKHPAFINEGRRRNKPVGHQLIDLAVHHSGLFPAERTYKGRPDIIHQIMLQHCFNLVNQTYSELEKQELNIPLRLWIHRRVQKTEEMFEVFPDWRIPVNYLRFKGLMEKLLIEKSLTAPPVVIHPKTLESFINEIRPEKIILWSRTGKEKSWKTIMKESLYYLSEKDKHLIWLIGGFQKGEPTDQVMKLANEQNQLISKGIPAWKVFGTLNTLIEYGMHL